MPDTTTRNIGTGMFFIGTSHLIHRIILSIYYTGSPHVTDDNIQRLIKLVQNHRIGDGAEFESVSSWLQGSCVMCMALYSNFVLLITYTCNKEDKLTNGQPEMGSFKVSTLEMGLVGYL